MAEPIRDGRWGWRAAYVGLFAGLMWLRLLPMGDGAARWPAPDVMLALTAALMLRRPDHLPAWLIAAVFLVEDLMLMRPPGLAAACAVLLAEFLRGRAALSRELPFPAEWLLVGVAMVAAALAQRVLLGITLAPLPPFGPAVMQVAGTVAAYPLAVVALRVAFGLRKPAAGEVDAMGRRL